LKITEFLYEARKRKVFTGLHFEVKPNKGDSILIKELIPSAKKKNKLKVLLALNGINYICNDYFKTKERNEIYHLQSFVFTCERNDVKCLKKLNENSNANFELLMLDMPIFVSSKDIEDIAVTRIKNICEAHFKEFKTKKHKEGKTYIECRI
jgi:hypothetical protein